MIYFSLVLVIAQAASLLFCGLTVYRLFFYIKRYRFYESTYTLLFGFIRLKFFVFLYVFSVLIASAVAGVMAFAFSMLTPIN